MGEAQKTGGRVKGRKATVKGVVTGFEWEGTGGFRTPDHILIEMSGGGDITEGGRGERKDGTRKKKKRGTSAKL